MFFDCQLRTHSANLLILPTLVFEIFILDVVHDPCFVISGGFSFVYKLQSEGAEITYWSLKFIFYIWRIILFMAEV